MARQHSDAGAFVFAAYFIQSVSWSIATNDAYLIQQESASACKSCQNYISAAAGLHDKGESQRGGRPTIRSEKVLTGRFPVRADHAFEFMLDESAAVLLPAAVSNRPARSNVDSVVYVTWIGNGWQVAEETSA